MSNPRTKAFTLVEMLVVMAIIGILAALLLPVLSGGQRRAQRIFCENSLQETGVAFHAFSNDHTGKFPMDVSTNDGGSMEFIAGGFHAGQIFYTAFRTFQVLSNELVRPQILVCPTDSRDSVSNFPALQNLNLSYFIGANGTFDQPASILAGDRSLTTNSFETPTILQIGLGSRLSWTWEMHQFQGNVLLADGHVEEWNQAGLKSAENQFSPDESLFLPSGPASQSATWQPPAMPAPVVATATESNATVAVVVPGEADAMMSPFDRNLTKTLQHTFGWLYLLFLLLVLLYLIYRMLKWMRDRSEKLKADNFDRDPEI